MRKIVCLLVLMTGLAGSGYSGYNYRVETSIKDNGWVTYEAYVHHDTFFERPNFLKNITVTVPPDKVDSGRAECIRQADSLIAYCKKHGIR